jgi:hypothetical protein
LLRISNEFLLGGGMLCGVGVFWGGSFVAWPCFVAASGWESESPVRDPLFFPLEFFFAHLLSAIFLEWGFGFYGLFVAWEVF